MESSGFKKFDCPRALLQIRKNPPKVYISNLKMICAHPEYIKPRKLTEKDVDKTVIKEILKSGISIDGAELIQDSSLRIS